MQTYLAHYRSPHAAARLEKGVFEYESDARLGTKANNHDARIRMLELYGSEAVSWTIVKTQRKEKAADMVDGQLELDFREPKPERKRKPRRQYL